MNRLVALTLAAGLACALAGHAAEPAPQALLTDALLCKGDPLEAVARLAVTPLEDGTFLLGCGWCNG